MRDVCVLRPALPASSSALLCHHVPYIIIKSSSTSPIPSNTPVKSVRSSSEGRHRMPWTSERVCRSGRSSRMLCLWCSVVVCLRRLLLVVALDLSLNCVFLLSLHDCPHNAPSHIPRSV